MITQEQLGQRLKNLRFKSGFTQKFVADNLSVTRQALINIEQGKRKVDSFELFKLAKMYGVNVLDIFYDKNAGWLNGSTNEDKVALAKFKRICADYEKLQKLR
jgi:transcriptional regulator with XRE-family HTH domain